MPESSCLAGSSLARSLFGNGKAKAIASWCSRTVLPTTETPTPTCPKSRASSQAPGGTAPASLGCGPRPTRAAPHQMAAPLGIAGKILRRKPSAGILAAAAIIASAMPIWRDHRRTGPAMAGNTINPIRCAIYTRKSTEHGLELEFNSLDAQREACEAYIKSQASQGWRALPQHYDDPAYSGGNLDRPALQRLLADIEAGKVEVVVVYKIDRLTRSLADFAKLVEAFDARSISFVAVTQQFNTTTSM